MKVTFLGATGTVTGSKYLLEDENLRILIDCGLFQGLKELRLRNWAELPVDPASIDAVILTHAHIDHSGYLPLLIKNGFKGKVYCTAATAELSDILLPDSGYLQEEDAFRANKYGYSKHEKALPLYTKEDAYDSLEYLKPVTWGEAHDLNDMISFQFTHAGHILGAACLTITDGQTKIVFSGDLGRPNDPVIREPAQIQEADYLVLESTYGDRLHEKIDPMAQLETIINETISKGGTVVIPAFAVGRAQSLMYYIYELKKAGRISGRVPVYVDSPMAINVTEILQRFDNEHRLSHEHCRKMCDSVIYTKSVEESKAIYNKNNGMPAIIISASGMATGGRVIHHLKNYITDERNTILLAGYQAAGTRGARLVQGEKELKMHGAMYPVKARIAMLDNISAHGDYQEIIDWLRHFREAPKKVYLTHGEPEAAAAFKSHIEEQLGWNVEIPAYMDFVEL